MNVNTEKNTKKNYVATGLIIVLLSFLVSITGVSFYLLYRDIIYNGVTIENIDVGGLHINEARQKVSSHFDTKASKEIQFVYGIKTWNINSEELGYSYDYTRALNEAYQIGREGNYFERLKIILSLYKEAKNINLTPFYDNGKFDDCIYKMKRDIDQPARNASIIRKNGTFEITDEKIGLKLNEDRVRQLLAENINDLKYDKDIRIDLPVESESPKITSEILSTIHDMLGSYNTTFSAANKTRTQNISLAARSINGTVLMPGDVFSFNEVVGPRSRERGYQDAPVIFNGELVEGLGGGVCQVSSTIYNAVLLSDMKVVERIKHTIPSTYVPKGRDATVSFGVLDFKFQNNRFYPVYIESYTRGNQMFINVYGNKTDNRVIKIHTVENEVVKRLLEIKYDSNMLLGQERIDEEGRDGYRVTTYKIIYENGVEVGREQISKDYYKPKKQVIVKGTKKPPKVTNKIEEEEKQKEEEAGIDSM